MVLIIRDFSFSYYNVQNEFLIGRNFFDCGDGTWLPWLVASESDHLISLNAFIGTNKKTTNQFIYRREQEPLPWVTLTPRIPTSKPRLICTIRPSPNACDGLRTLRTPAQIKRLASWLPPTTRTPFDLPSRRWRKLELVRRTKWSALDNFSLCAIISPSLLVSYLFLHSCVKINVLSINFMHYYRPVRLLGI